MSEITEQDDFESVVPPSIDGEDDGWDDDILPPPYISDDETSVASKEYAPYISEPIDSLEDLLGPKPTATLNNNVSIPLQLGTQLSPEIATTTSDAFEDLPTLSSKSADSLDDILGPRPASIVDEDVPVPPKVHSPSPPEVATTTPLPSNSTPISILDDDAFMPSLVDTPFVPEVATTEATPTTYLSDAKPAAIVDNDFPMSPQVNPSLVPEVATTALLSESAPVSIMPHLGNPTFVPEVAATAPLEDSKPAAIVDNDVSMHSPVHPSNDPIEIPVAATAWPCNATSDVPEALAVAEALPSNPAPLPQSTETVYNTSMQQAYLPQEEDIWHPEPSAPFEPNDVDESKSALSSILDALDPSERASFLEEQNKILENIERQTSEERASAQKAWNMMALENDAALAKKLQEQERKRLQQRLHNSVKEQRVVIKGSRQTERAIQDGSSIIVECLRCQKAMHVPQAIQVMYCPICKDITSFQKRTLASKKKTRGFFGRLGKSHKTKV